ncbi:hypothetical protein B0H12DRAFT_1117355 [Mycena haematopus]|nr:hypothetical protein B0H12DRAFT_1117355 [Mycena haematopus]
MLSRLALDCYYLTAVTALSLCSALNVIHFAFGNFAVAQPVGCREPLEVFAIFQGPKLLRLHQY